MWRNTCNYLMFFVRSLSRCSVKPWRISSALCELIGVRGQWTLREGKGGGFRGESHTKEPFPPNNPFVSTSQTCRDKNLDEPTGVLAISWL